MPRNGSGVYSLPAGNPVVTLTTIQSNWANTTFSDVASALTGSVASDGQTSMTGPLRLSSGVVGAPGLTFAGESTSGLYLNAANDIRFSVAGGDVLLISKAGLEVRAPTPAGPTLLVNATTGNSALQVVGTSVGDVTVQIQSITTGNAVLNLVALGGAAYSIGSRRSDSTLVIARGTALATTALTMSTNGVFNILAPGAASAPLGLTSFSGAASSTPTLAMTSTLTTDACFIAMGINGATNGAFIGLGASTNSLIVGSSTGELNFRCDSGAMNWTTVSGHQICVRLGSAGDFYYNDGLGTGTLQEIGFRGLPQNSKTANYTAILSDSGKHMLMNASGIAFNLPANASVAFPLGTCITVINVNAATLSITITTDSMRLAGTATTGSRTLASNGIATIIKVASTTWIISGTGLS